MKYFDLKPEETVDDLIEISDDEKFPEIIRDLLNIQQVAKGKNTHYNFNFQNFVSNCLKIEIDENNLIYLNTQIEKTFNLIYNSSISNELMFNYCQIKIIKNIYEELLDEIYSVKSEEKGNKLNSDELLRNPILRKTLLRFRLLEKLIMNDDTFTKGINPILYDENINEIIIQINNLRTKKDKTSFKEFIKYIRSNINVLPIIKEIFPYDSFNDKNNIISYF